MPIYLYSYSPSPSLNIQEVSDFLTNFSLKNEYRGNLFEFLNLNSEQTIEYKEILCSCRIYDIGQSLDCLYNELSSEESVEGDKRELYDGLWVQRKLFKFFTTNFPEEISETNLHLIFTDMLFCTYGEKRYHARVVLAGTPSLISTSGLIEAPARPREYYWMKANYIQSGSDLRELDNVFRDRYLEYDDERITSTISSYCLLPVFYHYIGEGFCPDKSCSLFNSHWQREILESHAKNTLCYNCLEKIRLISGIVS